MKYFNLLIAAFVIIFAGACEDEAADAGAASTYPISGEWYVHEYYGGGSPYGPYHLQIFNTAANNDSLWVSNIYDSGIKVRAIKNDGTTFSITEGADIAEEVATVTISNGQIIDNDSIYFDVILYDGDGEVIDEFYTAGRRWTGLEDEH